MWATVAGAGVATVLLKAAGPVVLGGRALPPRLAAAVELLAPSVLAALVVTQTVAEDDNLVFDDARLVGLSVAAVAIGLRAPLLVVVASAALVAAAARAL